MINRIHIFGASGSGVTTLGIFLAKQLGRKLLDTDSYYWEDTDPPFRIKQKPEDRVAMINRDTHGVDNWVLSGSICSWGDPLLHRFTLAVLLHLSPDLRMERILCREQERYGSRIEPGGDMHDSHVKFMGWANSYDHAKAPIRSLDLHDAWMTQLSCPVVRLDSAVPVKELCNRILEEDGKGFR